MTGVLSWRDDWLVLSVGPWCFSVADVEVFEDGSATASITGWLPSSESGSIVPQAGDVIAESEHGNPGEERACRFSVPCASRLEAVNLIRVALGLRGVVVPEQGMAGVPF